MITITGGAFQKPDGSPAAGGILLMHLSQDSQLTAAAYMDNGYEQATVVSGIPIVISLDSNGNVPANTLIWSNAELVKTTYYLVRVFAADGAPLVRYNINWIFTTLSGGTQDLGSMVNQTIPVSDNL